MIALAMQARTTAVLTLLLAALSAVCAASEPSATGVVVLGNHTQRELAFRIRKAGGKSKSHKLPADGVLTVALDGAMELAFNVDGAERKYALDNDSVYYFSQFPFGVDLEKASFAAPKEFVPAAVASHRGPRPGPRRIVERTDPTNTVHVKLVFDENPLLARERWEAVLRKRFQAAAALVEQASGLKFELTTVEAWRPPPGGARNAVEKTLQEIALQEAWLVLGVVSNQAGGGRIDVHPVPTPLSTHLLIGELPAPALEAEKTAQLAHLLGHYVGAGESPEPASIMHVDHAGLRARDARANRGFDAANVLAMRLVSVDVQKRGLRDWGELQPETRREVRSIQATLQQALPARLAARQFGRGFDRLPRDRQREAPGRAEMVFSGSLSDGTQFTGARVSSWYDDRHEPVVNHHAIFDAQRPLRWLRNDSVEAKTSIPAYVEFFGGDRLPGAVVKYQAASENDQGPVPAHVVVQPTEPLFWRDRQEESCPVRVQMGAIKCIAWQSRGERYQPGTAFLRGGARVKYRSVRFAAEGVRLLVDGEVKPLAYSDLAELHLPRVEPWQAWFEQLAGLAPSLSERLVQIETADGLVATTSTARLRAQGSADDPQSWRHVVQPTWSLDPLWLSHRTIALRRFFDPTEVPLTAIEPTSTARKAFFSSAWDWQTNRSAQLGPLQCGGREFAWGLGVHAYSELEYDLPSPAESFRCLVGLDHVAGSGGCARALIYTGSTKGKPLFRSELLIGSTRTFDTGLLPVNDGGQKAARLLLMAHPAHKERPSGADPLDVRDSVDWLEPLVICNRAALSSEIQRRTPALLPAWADWSPDADTPVRLVSLWDKTDSANPYFRYEALPTGDMLALTRTWRVRSASSHLEISVSRFGAGPTPSKIEVFAEGQLLDDFKVLVDNPRNPQSHAHSISLSQFVGRDVALRIVQHCEGQASSVLWRRLAVVE